MPSTDKLAATVRETRVAGRDGRAGHFRVYLAAAAGAGKTIAMLAEGQRRQALGADVVIPIVEDHNRPLTADVGATWHDLDAGNLASALVEYAKHEQVTQIVLGSSQRSHWPEFIGGASIVGSVSRLAARAGIDVHIMALHEPAAR